ncbi:alpha/beta fold hydrolase [Acidisoma sp. C75]
MAANHSPEGAPARMPARAGDPSPKHGSLRYLLADGFHDMAYTGWGEPERPTVICVHGLTRQGRDFDRLAAALAADFYVLCPDLPGRGGSDWLAPALYQPLTYVTALATLCATRPGPVRWVGTSLGGICGMILAAQPKTPVSRLVLNDIGPFIPAAALARIRDYMQPPPVFADLAGLEAHLRVIHAPFAVPDDAGWAEMAAHSARAVAGGLTLHYDPAIGDIIRATEPNDVDLRAYWNAITAPVFTIRGALSDLLLPETLAEMDARPGALSLTLPETGHAPALMDRESIRAICDFLKED